VAKTISDVPESFVNGWFISTFSRGLPSGGHAPVVSPRSESEKDSKRNVRPSVVETNNEPLRVGSAGEWVVFAVEVVHQRVDDGKVKEVEVERTLVVRLHRSLHQVTVYPIVETKPRPPDETRPDTSTTANIATGFSHGATFTHDFAAWQFRSYRFPTGQCIREHCQTTLHNCYFNHHTYTNTSMIDDNINSISATTI